MNKPGKQPLNRQKNGLIDMMQNVGGKERALRAIFGSSVVVFDYLATVQIEVIFLIIGLWTVLTSAFGYCPFNGLFNRNSCAIPVHSEHAA